MDNLLMAIKTNNLKDVKRILDAKKVAHGPPLDLNQTDSDGDMPILTAVARGNQQIFELLLNARGAGIIPINPNIGDYTGTTPLMLSSQYGLIDMVKLLLATEADIDDQDTNRWTALMFAANYGKQEVVQLLIDEGADIEITNADEHTALMLAADQGYEGVIEILLEAGDDSNFQNRFGHTALMFAAQYRNYDIIKLLLDAGADPNLRSTTGWTALMHAVTFGNKNIVKLLLNAGADPTFRNSIRKTAFDLATKNPDIRNMLKTYVHRRINPNTISSDNVTNLMVAASHFPAYKLHELIRLPGLDINHQDQYGNTALFYAIDSNDYWKVRVLLNNHANPLHQNKAGITPAEYGVYSSNPKIQVLFGIPFIFRQLKRYGIPMDIINIITDYVSYM